MQLAWDCMYDINEGVKRRLKVWSTYHQSFEPCFGHPGMPLIIVLLIRESVCGEEVFN